MFLIISNSFDENVEITCIYIYCVFSPSFLSDVFEVYIYQKSQGNAYIYIHVILTCSSCMSKFVSICKTGKFIFEPV